jgi:site-specific recombinase XerD
MFIMPETNNIKIKNYIPQYEQYLIIDQAKSKNTVVNYISDLKHYFDKFDRIDRESIQGYKEYLRQELNLSITTINRKLSSVKSFNQYLITLGYRPCRYCGLYFL